MNKKSNKKKLLQKLKKEKFKIQDAMRELETNVQLLQKEEKYILMLIEKTKKTALNKGYGFIDIISDD
jgi:hypothetical protein